LGGERICEAGHLALGLGGGGVALKPPPDVTELVVPQTLPLGNAIQPVSVCPGAAAVPPIVRQRPALPVASVVLKLRDPPKDLLDKDLEPKPAAPVFRAYARRAAARCRHQWIAE
jgi:hypothetical protein